MGSKVCFVDGRPFKNEYRRFKVNSVNNDDYRAAGSHQSALPRRGRGWELYPDVILIDGGLGRSTPPWTSSTHSTSAADGREPRQRKNSSTSSGKPAIKLGRDNLGLKLLQQVRDERTASQHYHHIRAARKRSGNKALQSGSPGRRSRDNASHSHPGPQLDHAPAWPFDPEFVHHQLAPRHRADRFPRMLTGLMPIQRARGSGFR